MTGTPEQIAVWLMRQEDRSKLYDISEHKEKRHLTQNAYYWVLLGKLAPKLHMSTARVHNIMLRHCAYPFIIGGKVAMQAIPDTPEAEENVLEATTYHVKPTSGVIKGRDGETYRWYVILRGSSDFNVQEMSALLDHLIEECKAQRIETLSTDEIERMRQYERVQEQKKQGNGNTEGGQAEGVGA